MDKARLTLLVSDVKAQMDVIEVIYGTFSVMLTLRLSSMLNFRSTWIKRSGCTLISGGMSSGFYVGYRVEPWLCEEIL